MLIACVYKTGGDYTAEYVKRLHDACTEYAPSVRFVCLSDADNLPCERIPLKHNWPGWWSKMELFRLQGPVLYFDLDTVITGDLMPLIQHATNTQLTMLSDFYRPHLAQSGVMAWGSDQSSLYDDFAESPIKIMHAYKSANMWGDGAYIYARNKQADRWQDVLPGMVSSRKVTDTRNKNERVVCFHGQPRPHSVGWQV